uniref:Uncharacterized protein n=1 Tax=Arundo donax TaxID=35708 RepID=A0A0A9HDW0_ARUDO
MPSPPGRRVLATAASAPPSLVTTPAARGWSGARETGPFASASMESPAAR